MKNIRSITLFTLTILFCSACNSSDTKTSSTLDKESLGKVVGENNKTVNDNEGSDSTKPVNDQNSKEVVSNTVTNAEGYTELSWQDLLPPQNNSEAIKAKYKPLIDNLTDDMLEAKELYAKMEEEFKEIPPNKLLAKKKVAIPGFIAPLEQNNGLISEFLLVPYFGACMHMPAPPSNQVVHVKVDSDNQIRVEDAYDPIWVSGQVLIDSKVTDIGSADYKIHNAKISVFE